jgi:uncharacterized RDD family membrane protein YckC
MPALRAIWAVLILCAISLLSGSASGQQLQNASHSAQDRVMVGSDLIVREDERVKDVLVIGGNANINGQVDGEVTIIGGALTLNGKIRDSLTVVIGKAVISEEAEVGGECTLMGGPFVIHPDARIMQKVNQYNFGDLTPKIEWLKGWIFHGLVLGRPIAPAAPWTFLAAAIFLGIYLLVGLAFPQPVQASVAVVEQNPVTALVTGLIALFLFGPLCLLLIVSVAGILTLPFLFCGLFLIFLFGKTAVFGVVGRSLASAMGLKRFPLVLGVLAGGVLISITYVVPILGILMWGSSAVVGIGAVILAISQSFKREAASMPPVPVALKASPAAAAASSPGALPLVEDSSSGIRDKDVLLLQRAGFWRRFASGSLDFIALMFLIPLLHATLPIAGLSYLIIMWTFWGSSLGGMIMGLKVVRLDGRPVTFSVAAVRALSSILSAAVFFLGFLWVAFDREKQGWHDKIAGTTVVRLPKGRLIL